MVSPKKVCKDNWVWGIVTRIHDTIRTTVVNCEQWKDCGYKKCSQKQEKNSTVQSQIYKSTKRTRPAGNKERNK